MLNSASSDGIVSVGQIVYIHVFCSTLVDLTATRDCYCLATRRRAREITRHYDEKRCPNGRQSRQFSVPAVLGVKGLTPLGELADILGLERTSLTRSADRLADEGWVTDAESDDARVCQLKLTVDGHGKIESAYLAWKEAQDEVDEQMNQLAVE